MNYKIDVLKKTKDFIDETGSTWYKPLKKEYGLFKKGVMRGVLVEDNGYFTLPLIKKQEEEIAKYVVARLHYDEDNRQKYDTKYKC